MTDRGDAAIGPRSRAADRGSRGCRSISRSGAASSTCSSGARAASSGPSTGSTSTIQRGEVLAPRRRVGLAARRRPAGSSSSSPARPPARSPSTATTSSTLWGDEGAARLPPPGPAHLPGPVRDAEPEADDPRLRGRAARSSTGSASASPSARPRSCARARGGRAAAGRRLRRSATRTSCPAASASASSSPAPWSWTRSSIVADEPVSMLDVSIRTELLRLMLDLRQERGLTYLFITHDLSLAWVIADRIAVMYLGKIMEIGPAEQVIRVAAQPVHAGARVGARRRRIRPTPGTRARRTILVGETPDAAAHPDRLPVPPALPAGVRPLPGRGAAAVRRRRRASRPRAGSPRASALAGPSPVAATAPPRRPPRRPPPRRPPPGRRPAATTDGPAERRRRHARPSPAARPRCASPTCSPPRPRPSSPSCGALGDEAGWRPAPGEWSANECVGHLIEAERRGFAGRIRPILAAAAETRPSRPTSRTGIRRPSPRRGATTCAPAAELAAEFEALRADGVDARPRPRPGRPRRASGMHPSRRTAARRRAARRMGPPRPEPHPPDAGRHARRASGLRWATPGGSASRTSSRSRLAGA